MPFVVPDNFISDRGRALVIRDGKLYHITKKRAVLDEIDGIGLPLQGIFRCNIMCADYPLCKCSGVAMYNEVTNTFSDVELNAWTMHDALCPWNNFAICVEYHKALVYKNLINGTFHKIRPAYEFAERAFTDIYPDSVVDFPPLMYFTSKGNWILRKRFPAIPVFAELPGLEIPHHLTVTAHSGGLPFLLFKHSYFNPPDTTYPEGRMETMFAFATARKFRALCRSRVVHADGTFKVCPAPFYQLMIFYQVVSSQLRPRVFVLLTRKTEITYQILFEKMRDLAVERQHPFIWMLYRGDFEKAIMNAVSTVFPGICKTGCLFHFTSAIYKFMASLGLVHFYNHAYVKVKHTVKCLFALAFLPAELVAHVFGEIRHYYESLPPLGPPYLIQERPDLTELFDYFYHCWILGDVAVPAVWTISDLNSMRTNNGAEGLNSKLKVAIGMTENLFTFIDKLRLVEREIFFQDLRVADGQLVLPRPKYRNINIRLQDYKNRFENGEILPLAYVKAIAYLMPEH